MAVTALAGFAALLTSSVPTSAQTSPQAAQSFMEGILAEGRETMIDEDLTKLDKHNLAHSLVSRAFDLETMARFVLGGQRRTLDADTQTAFSKLYHDYLVASYVGKIAEFAAQPVTIDGTEAYGGSVQDALVKTTITTPDGKERAIGWRVRQKAAGPRILDMVIGGVSFLATQRSEFKELLGSKGIEGLMEAMESLVERNTPEGGASARAGDNSSSLATAPTSGEAQSSSETTPAAPNPSASNQMAPSRRAATTSAGTDEPTAPKTTGQPTELAPAETASADRAAMSELGEKAETTARVAPTAEPASMRETPAPRTPSVGSRAERTRGEARAIKAEMDELIKALERINAAP